MSRVEKKADFITISIYSVLGAAALYSSAALGACFDLASDNDGNVDFELLTESLDSTLTDTHLVFSQVQVGGYAAKFPVFAAFGIGLYVLTKITGKKKFHRRHEEHGSARWANKKEIRSLADRPQKKGRHKARDQPEKAGHRNPAAVMKTLVLRIRQITSQLKQIPLWVQTWFRQLPRRLKSGITRIPGLVKSMILRKPKAFVRDNNIILTNEVKMSLNTRQTRKNLNVMVIGGSGSGKSRFYVKPNLMQANTSYVCTDPNPVTYRYNPDDTAPNGAISRFKANIEAIQTLQRVEAENRYATPEEQSIMARYVGWGGIPQAFVTDRVAADSYAGNLGELPPTGWEAEQKQLLELLSPDEYALRSSIPMPDAARFYGLEINRAEFAACPFHPDNTPSLKIYEDHYYCFGRGAHGDVTDFTARLFRISQYDAAVKLNADFGLHLTDQQSVPMHEKVSPEVACRNWLHSAETLLNEYLNMLCRWRMEYAPKTPDEKLHPHFVESLTKMEQYRFLYEQIRFGSESEKRRLYLTEHETLRKLAERMKQLTAVKSAPKRKAI